MEVSVAAGDCEPGNYGAGGRAKELAVLLNMNLHLALFLIFGAICVAGAINLLVQRHPISSALSLITVMASLAVEYLLLGAEFVAAVQVIIYAGAIMVLFVFVIMLLCLLYTSPSP